MIDIPDCPRNFCFMFRPAGAHYAPGIYQSFEEAMANANVVALKDKCGCIFGSCRRWSKNPDDHDWYEPHEPNLEKAGLSHDHFVQK